MAGKNGFLGTRQKPFDGGVLEKAVAQLLVDALVHPVLGLLCTAMLEIAVSLDKVNVLEDHIPHFLDAEAIEA